jgi:flagellum-specific peptidoglycan hydrolase FlgJ
MATAEQQARLKAVVPAAQASMRRWGVPASVTLAQWKTESTWGASQLALKANNFFGIKASHLANPETYVEFPTAEYESGKRVIVEALFERYYDAADSFSDHARLLARSARYHMAMLAAKSPDSFAFFLEKAGYSTNPTYAADLVRLMHDGNLYQYDQLPPEPAAGLASQQQQKQEAA